MNPPRSTITVVKTTTYVYETDAEPATLEGQPVELLQRLAAYGREVSRTQGLTITTAPITGPEVSR